MDLTYSYSRKHSPSAPAMELRIGGSSVELMLDTGFSGGVLLPFRTFQSLGLLSKLTPDTYRVVMPDSRTIFAYTASEEVALGPVKVITKLHASPALNKSLAGRDFLRLVMAKLDGPKEMLTLTVA